MSDIENASLPDLRGGIPTAVLRERGMQLGQVDGDEVLLVLSDGTPFAIGAHCTHYHGPLADGLVVGDTVRCPWHHACFSLRTGEALRAPALDPIPCWRVEQRGDKVFVREKIAAPAQREAPVVRMPQQRAGIGRHRRRRRGGPCRGRHAAARRLRRHDHI